MFPKEKTENHKVINEKVLISFLIYDINIEWILKNTSFLNWFV